MPADSLLVGFVPEQGVKTDVVREMLDQLGVCYEEARDGVRYAAVVVPSSDGEAYQGASSHTGPSGIVSASDACDLTMVLGSLSGTIEERRDMLDAPVNVEEEKLSDRIAGALAEAGRPFVRKAPWPGGKALCCVVTHDVDWLHYSPFHRVVFSRRLGARRLLSLLYGGLKKRDYGGNIAEMVALESSRGVKSTFLLRPEYPGDEDGFADALELLKSKGFEVGLHGLDDAYRSRGPLGNQLDSLGRKSGARPRGVRHHILKVSIPETWSIAQSESLLYDATFAWNRFFGFRGGICSPYHPFAPGRLPLLELPTGFMDWTALHRRERGDKMLSRLKEVHSTVLRHRGVLVANFHNTYVNSDTFDDVVGALEYLLTDSTAASAWYATAEECAGWWNSRASEVPSLSLEDPATVRAASSVPLEAELAGKKIEVRA